MVIINAPVPSATAPEDQSLDWLPENYKLAQRIKSAHPSKVNLELPRGWNVSMPPHPFQKKGAAWMFVAQRGICADQVGTGKSIEALLLTMMLRDRGRQYKTVVITLKSIQQQFKEEAEKFTDLKVIAPAGSKAERVHQYQSRWELLITTYPLLLRDIEYLLKVPFQVLIADEASFVRHHDIQTKGALERLSRGKNYILLMDATPIQTSILDIHSLFEVLHMNVFGAIPAFDRRYIRREKVKKTGKNPFQPTSRVIGYKNMGEFKARISPFIIRRRAQDPEVEADLPDILTITRNVELYPEQRRQYTDAKRGIITLFEQGERVRARASFHHLLQACVSTIAFGDPKPRSSKIDWIVDQMRPASEGGTGGDLYGEKIVIFSRYKTTITHLQKALSDVGVHGHRYTGDMSQDDRVTAVKAFWNDPEISYLVGTVAMARGLNLQRSAYMIAIDQLFNPRMMEQLLGRLRRIGSVHAKVRLINQIAVDTIEEKLMRLINERAAVQDWVFGETSEMFDQLSDNELLALIQE